LISVEQPDFVAASAKRAARGERIAGLAEAAREGSEEAIGQLVTEFSPLMWQIARAAGLHSGDAEDVVQTVWLRLLGHLQGIRTPAALAAWLATTTRREAWRVRSADRRRLPVDQDWMTAIPDPAPGAEELVITGDQQRELWQALSQLDERCQELLRIVAFVPRVDYDVIAAELDMPRGSIGPTRGRCLAKLRALLAATAEGTTQ
jgi:RNA polymerase sigma factor (sigma-70 family)